jgi:hypothetical protein
MHFVIYFCITLLLLALDFSKREGSDLSYIMFNQLFNILPDLPNILSSMSNNISNDLSNNCYDLCELWEEYWRIIGI